MSENTIGQTSGDKNEQALLQALLQGLEKAKDQGLSLPASVPPPVQPAEQQTQTTIVTQPPVQVSTSEDTVMTPVAESKKRKAEDDPRRVTEPEKPVEIVTTVAEKDVPPEPVKLTAKALAEMSENEISKLTPADVSHLKMEDVTQLRPMPSLSKRNAIRPLLDPSVRKQQEQLKEKKQKIAGRLSEFNAVKNNIQKAGDWYTHYDGTSQDDIRFRRFLERKGYTPKTLIERVVSSSRVAEGQYCAFRNSDRGNRICEVVIDLGGFFEDDQMRGMNIAAGITHDALEVFHAGPGG